MAKKVTVPGINIQWPISDLILVGKKTIETRTYGLPAKYVGKDLAFIETPGTSGAFKARIVGLIRFKKSFQYMSKQSFYADSKRHCVSKDSKWKWDQAPKWGWEIERIVRFNEPQVAPRRKGIKFTSNCVVTV